MVLLRFLGSIFLLIAALSLIHDGSLSVTRGNGVVITPIGEHWIDISPATFEFAQAALLRVVPWLWDPVVLAILLYPAWLIFGTIGAAICYAGRSRRRTNIFAN